MFLPYFWAMKTCILAVFLLLLTAPGVRAQGCSICTKTSGQLGDKSAKGLNNGVVYLAIVPLSLIGTIGFIWWRHNKNN